jgi:hypothetical protein
LTVPPPAPPPPATSSTLCSRVFAAVLFDLDSPRHSADVEKR